MSAFRKLSSIYVFSYVPFGFEGRIWDLIVSVPDHCLSFYFVREKSFFNKSFQPVICMHVNSVLYQIEKTLRKLKFLRRQIFYEFLKTAISEKVTTDFENRTKRKAETKHAPFLTCTTKLCPTEQVQSILQPQISTHFAHFRFECKQLKSSVTRY